MTDENRPRRSASPRSQKPWSPRSRRVVAAFIDACEQRDPQALGKLLRRNVELTIDSGGAVPIRNRASGRSDVTDLLLELIAYFPRLRLEPGEINGTPGIVLLSAQHVVGVLNAARRGGRAQQLWIVVNPDKLRHWNAM
jgi:RNA polymerase sigma-70 factor (ECF subfamily)